MKKITLLLLLFASMAFQTASAKVYEVYSVNVSADEQKTASGVIWEPYDGPVDFFDDYSDFSFMVGSGSLEDGSSFTGYSTVTGGSYIGFYVPGASNSDTYTITAYSLLATPQLSTIDPFFGSILSFKSSGTTQLDAVNYNYATYSAQLNDNQLFAYYDTPLNAVQLAVPEPASLVLIGIGGIMAAAMKRQRYSTEA